MFNIYEKNGVIDAVKVGWSWPGFFFNWLWALIKQQWFRGLAAGVIILLVAIVIFALSLPGPSTKLDIASNIGNLIGSAISFIFGLYGNRWQEHNLTVRGFIKKDSIIADNKSYAIFKHQQNKERKSKKGNRDETV